MSTAPSAAITAKDVEAFERHIDRQKRKITLRAARERLLASGAIADPQKRPG